MSRALNDTVCLESIKRIMEIFRSKWAFLIIGELHEGPRRFNEIKNSLGINTKSLTDALLHLEVHGIITRTVLPTVPITVTYELTEKGFDFEKVFIEMREWGKKWLQ